MKVFRPVWWMPTAKVIGVTLVLAALARLPGVREFLHPDRFRLLAAHSGWWGYVALLTLGACMPIALMPRWPFAVFCGLAYGVERGVLMASLAGVLGAAMHYKLAQLLLSGRERSALENTSWFQTLQSSPRPFLAITAVRLFPLSSFAITNLACGLLRVPFGCYLGASVIGMMPSTVVYVMAGSGALNGNVRLLVWAVALAALAPPATLFLKLFQAQGVENADSGGRFLKRL